MKLIVIIRQYHNIIHIYIYIYIYISVYTSALIWNDFVPVADSTAAVDVVPIPPPSSAANGGMEIITASVCVLFLSLADDITALCCFRISRFQSNQETVIKISLCLDVFKLN